MKPLPRWVCYLALIIAGYGSAAAREIVYTNLNCAITYPNGWPHFPVPQSNYIAMVKDIDQRKSVMVQVRAADPNLWPVMNEQFKTEGREAFRKEGVLTKESAVTMDGVPGWEIAGRVEVAGQEVTTVSRIVIADGKAYKINVMYMEGDAATETNLQACLNSFRFLTPPPPPRTVERGPVRVFLLVFAGVAAWLTTWAVRRVRRAQNTSAAGQA